MTGQAKAIVASHWYHQLVAIIIFLHLFQQIDSFLQSLQLFLGIDYVHLHSLLDCIHRHWHQCLIKLLLQRLLLNKMHHGLLLPDELHLGHGRQQLAWFGTCSDASQ